MNALKKTKEDRMFPEKDIKYRIQEKENLLL